MPPMPGCVLRRLAVRQPIESLFNWIEEKTGIEARQGTFFQGLLVHVFGAWRPPCFAECLATKALNSHLNRDI